MDFTELLATSSKLTSLEAKLLLGSQRFAQTSDKQSKVDDQKDTVSDVQEHSDDEQPKTLTQRGNFVSDSPRSIGKQLLPHCVLVRVAKYFLHEPKDVFHLALAEKKLWRHLELEIYCTDVLNTKEQERLLLINNSILEDSTTAGTLHYLLNTPLAVVTEAATRYRLFTLRANLQMKRTALHYAAYTGKMHIARKAIIASTKCWPGYIDTKIQNCVPLMLAVIRGHNEIVRLLIESGCFVDAWHDEPRGARNWIHGGCEFIKNLEVRSRCFRRGHTVYSPLCYAIAMRRPSQALLLAQHTSDGGLEVNVGNKLQIPPLHLAAFAGMAPVVKALIERGYNSCAPSSLFRGATPLEMAASGVDNNRDVMQLLLESSTEASGANAPWIQALIHRASKNALFLLQHRHQHHKLFNLSLEVKYCLESDELLPVLKWILENDEYLSIRQYSRRLCQKLVEKRLVVPSATLKYLCDKGIVETLNKEFVREVPRLGTKCISSWRDPIDLDD